MTVIDILTRVDALCRKYEKYDVEKHKDSKVVGDDAFFRLYAAVESEIEAALQKAESASQKKSRAAAVAINAEIRRTKARLLDEVPNLHRLAAKKVKGLSTEELAACNDFVLALPYRIQAIPAVLVQLYPNHREVGELRLLVKKSDLIQMDDLKMNIFSKLKSQVSSAKSMKCGK